jgi:hypothetical protein
MHATDLKPLPVRAGLAQYTKQAKNLIAEHRAGNPRAIQRIRQHHPRLPGRPNTNDRNLLSDSTIRRLKLSLSNAQEVVARWHGFESWRTLRGHLEALTQKESTVLQFELAVEAIISGEVAALKALLRQNLQLVRARSTREHHATLLHYVGANGVEGYRQKTPRNAVAIAKVLLRAGAEVDADLDYGVVGRKRYPERFGSTTLGMVATSCHPANMGVQLALLGTLLAADASVDGLPGGWSPVIAALHNGRGDAAEYLARQGARLDVEAAAGTGQLETLKRLLKKVDNLKAKGIKKQIESGLMWACEYGRANVVDFLVTKGIDIAAQPHGETALHWAAYGGHPEVVKLLLKRKVPVEARDRNFRGTPLGWALYAWCDPPPEAKAADYYSVAKLLVAAGAKVDPAWLGNPDRGRPLVRKIQADARMLGALLGHLAQ